MNIAKNRQQERKIKILTGRSETLDDSYYVALGPKTESVSTNNNTLIQNTMATPVQPRKEQTSRDQRGVEMSKEQQAQVIKQL